MRAIIEPFPIRFLPFDIPILRPDDLVELTIQAINLKLDLSDAKNPKLVFEDSASPAYLVVNFQPQTIIEKAYFEVAANVPSPGQTQDDPLDPPGQVPVRMGGGSRLVFQLPKGMTSVPYNISSLLDWSALDLVVSPVALGQVLPTPITAPTATQTAIELPYRLILSPGANVGWTNATEPETFQGRTALWHTSLAAIKNVKSGSTTKRTLVEPSLSNTLPLRAIWSQDFVDHGVLPLPADLGSFPELAAMTPRDRFQIVILTSGASNYYVMDSQGHATPWVPVPIQANRLFLSTLGGSLDSRGEWPSPPGYSVPGAEAQQLDLTEWIHIATLGRDHYVRIVYEGFLYPFGHKATLIKVTERKVVPPNGTDPSSPTAYLKQHMYIVVKEREKSYASDPYLYSGRENPFWQSIGIKTIVTPDIDKPQYIAASPDSFWIEVGAQGFPFHMTATDWSGTTFDFKAQLIFMSISEPNPAGVQTEYAGNANRVCTMKGTKIAYADPSAGDTVLKTDDLLFTTQLLQTEQPFTGVPFLPTLDLADVSVPALEQLLGTTNPVRISLYSGYLSNGMDSNAGVFVEVASGTTKPPVAFSAKQSGGFSTPSLALTSLSARKGIVAGNPDDAAAGNINPKEFFDITAELFGVVPLPNLIPVNSLGMAGAAVNAPEIRTHASPNSKNPTSITTQLNWSPQLKDFTSADGILHITFNQNGPSALTLQAKVTRNLTGGQPTFVSKGELSNFLVSLAGVVDVQINSITFTNATGQKQNVAAKLPSSNAVTFTGALSFVQELANVLPPGIFGGSGPSIQLEPSYIRATITIGLPTLNIGVFALSGISFMAGIQLPYINGKPAFEFAFASRGSPFLLTIECLGGGGFVHVVVDTSGVQMVEGALEFGGSFSIDLGVASGGVHIMAGIYFKIVSTATTVTGFVDIGGEVSVMGIISISIDLNLSLSYDTGTQKITGKATLSISVHIIFFSISVSVSVERSFGSNGGDPRMIDAINLSDWEAYALAFA